MLWVARPVNDIESSKKVSTERIAEVIQYRVWIEGRVNGASFINSIKAYGCILEQVLFSDHKAFALENKIIDPAAVSIVCSPFDML